MSEVKRFDDFHEEHPEVWDLFPTGCAQTPRLKIYPDHDGFFRIREQRSQKEAAVELPELGPEDFPYE